MKTKRFVWIGILAIIKASVLIMLFACNNANNSEGSGSGGFGGIIAPTDSKDVLVQVGNTTVKFSELTSDQRFKQLVADKIFAAILIDKGLKERIEISEEDVDKRIATIKKQFPDEAIFNKTLKDNGYTIESLRFEQRRYLILDKLLRNKLQFTEEDLRDFYDQNKRLVDQGYAAENGLTEEETLNLTYETVRESVDRVYMEQKGMEVFTELREELIREYHDSMKFKMIPKMTLADFQIFDDTTLPGTDSGDGGETTPNDDAVQEHSEDDGHDHGGEATPPPAEGEASGG